MAKNNKAKSNTKIVKKTVYVEIKEVNWVLLLVMSVIFGWVGVDRFIMGKVGTGLLKLFTLGGLGIWWLVDMILIATKYEYKNVRYIE